MKCTYCKSVLEGEEADNPRTDNDGDIMCDQCYSEQYEDICPICEESFEKPTGPERHYEIIALDDGTPDLPAGIYRVLEWPFFWSDCIGGGDVFKGAIFWMAPLPVYKQVFGYQEIYSGTCCLDCAAKYAGYTGEPITIL